SSVRRHHPHLPSFPTRRSSDLVNAELTSADDHNGPEMQLYKAILAKYGQNVAGGVGSFSEMGYLLGKFSTDALLKVKGAYNIKRDRKSTRLNSSHSQISYAVFC